MVTLTDKDIERITLLLRKIRQEAGKTIGRKLVVENLARRAMLVINNAGRRRQRTTRLKFETGDFD